LSKGGFEGGSAPVILRSLKVRYDEVMNWIAFEKRKELHPDLTLADFLDSKPVGSILTLQE
jgi:hypothetical protein